MNQNTDARLGVFAKMGTRENPYKTRCVTHISIYGTRDKFPFIVLPASVPGELKRAKIEEGDGAGRLPVRESRFVQYKFSSPVYGGFYRTEVKIDFRRRALAATFYYFTDRLSHE